MDNPGDAQNIPIVMLGGSAGALDPLQAILGRLPADLGAAVFITTHVPPDSPSALPHILSRAGSMFATHGIDRAPIAPNHVIVAPPNHHLFVDDGRMRVVQGPKENNHRPSIDVLFRSGAQAAGPAACAVLLSGTLDDGVAGLLAVKKGGGKAFVQDPGDAQFEDLPLNGMRSVDIDGAATASGLADLICDFVRAAPASRRSVQSVVAPDEREFGKPSVFTCPDCKGTLWELDREVLRYRCRTGHAFSAHTFLSMQDDVTESGFWAAVRALEERRDLLRKVAKRAERLGDPRTSDRLAKQAEAVERDMEAIENTLRAIISRRESA